MIRYIAVALLFGASAFGTTTFVSQSGGSVSCGADGTQSTTAIGSVTWTAGNAYKLCGAITSGFTIGANTVTVFWETGARVSLTFGQIINLNGKNNLVFDGGTACGHNTTCSANEATAPLGYASDITGIIEATANGSGLAHQDVQTQAFWNAAGSHDIEIKNLIIRNLYQHTLLSDVTSSADTGNFIFQCPFTTGCASGTISIHDSDIHDVGNAISFQRGSGTTVNIFNNEFWHDNWAMENSGNGTRTVNFHDNHVHDTKSWDTTSDAFHHNSLHNFMNVSSDSLGLYVYNNLYDGDWGACCTTALGSFTETVHPANFFEFNNVAIQSCNTNTAPVFDYGGITSAHGAALYNNTFLGCAPTAYTNVRAYDVSGTSVVSENNADQNFGQYVVVNAGATLATFDFNVYGPIGAFGGNSPWQCTGSGVSNFTAWKLTSCSPDANGQKVASLGVDANGVPQTGSALTAAGKNLTSLCGIIPALCFDKNGTARPSTGSWTAGAIQVGSFPAVTVLPISLSFGTVAVGSNSSPQSVTLKNVGTANLHLTSETITIGTDFTIPSRSINDCSLFPTLSAGSSCTITVQFSPTASGTRNDTLKFVDDASDSPQIVPLIGIGGSAPASPVGLSAVVQ